MKKNLLFAIPMLIVAVVLFLLSKTGMTAHIAVGVVGLVILIAYTIATKKAWKSKVLEILQRVCYAVALITGIVLMRVDATALSVVHRAGALLFVLLFVICEIHKVAKK